MRRPIAFPPIPPELELPRPPRAVSAGSGARLWLVRHARVAEPWEEVAYGNHDVPLSPDGERDTRAVAERFANASVERVISSPLSRALAMGRAIAQASGAPLVEDARLAEVHRGEWQLLPREEFRARWLADRETFLRDPWSWKGHGGESDADLYARAAPLVEELVRAAPGKTLVLASHYNLIRALVAGTLGWSAQESFALWIAPARAALLVDEPGGWRLALSDVEPDPRAQST